MSRKDSLQIIFAGALIGTAAILFDEFILSAPVKWDMPDDDFHEIQTICADEKNRTISSFQKNLAILQEEPEIGTMQEYDENLELFREFSSVVASVDLLKSSSRLLEEGGRPVGECSFEQYETELNAAADLAEKLFFKKFPQGRPTDVQYDL